MMKAHQRKNRGWMRRTSRLYLTEANRGKVAAVRAFLLLYTQVLTYFMAFFWTRWDFTATLAESVITRRAVNRCKITARLAPAASKQAKETVRSQHECHVKTMPRLRRKVTTLDSRFATIDWKLWDWRESIVSVDCQLSDWKSFPYQEEL